MFCGEVSTDQTSLSGRFLAGVVLARLVFAKAGNILFVYLFSAFLVYRANAVVVVVVVTEKLLA